MKERPILFSASMVQAILSGQKSMTRRVVKDYFFIEYPNYFEEHNSVMNKPPHKHADNNWYYELQDTVDSTRHSRLVYPNGAEDDRLWVRESWAVHFMYSNLKPSLINTSGWLEGDSLWYKENGIFPLTGKCVPGQRGKWRPSIFMPRWASRITLEITDIRVERLQDITEEDAHKEGIDIYKPSQWDVPFMKEVRSQQDNNGKDDSLAVAKFAHLWNAINGKKYPWSSNPWLWPISFRRLGA